MIIVVHALLEEHKNELLAEINKIRVENGIQEKNIIVINIPKTLENPKILALSETAVSSTGLKNELLAKSREIQADIHEEIILENLPEMIEIHEKSILPENNISLEESRARNYHTKNMVQQFNSAQQYHHKRTYYNSRTRRR
jgi:hypothetical protein